jgi:AI-2 transport protein TqsA
MLEWVIYYHILQANNVKQMSSIGNYFVVLAAVVVVLAGIKSAAVIIVPFLLALFIAIILSPLFEWLNRKGLPAGLSLFAVVVLFIGVISLVGMLVGSSVQDFNTNLPGYEEKLRGQIDEIAVMLEKFGIEMPRGDPSSILDPGRVMQYAATALQSAGSLLADGLVILLTVVFILLESARFTQKIKSVDRDEGAMKHLSEVIEKIKQYMVLKAVISLVTGIAVTLILMAFGLDYAVLWGVVAFLLNFIPNIGSIIAAIPAVLLALIQLGPLSAAGIAVTYIVINTLIGSVIEPKVMGKGLGLSTLVVFLSLIFWGWLLGPVGMLLSIPLTIMVKIALASQPDTKWVAVLLNS